MRSWHIPEVGDASTMSVLGSLLLQQAGDTPFLGFGALRERRALLPWLMAW